MIKKLKYYWPIFFIFGVWFIFSSPYFLKGKVPYASDYQVNFFPPWSHYPKFGGPVKNNAMPDIHGQIYPWKKFTIDTFKLGQIPFWNPYNFSGNPHLANYQSAVFSPFNILFFVLPFIDAWSVLILLQPILAGFFTYLLMRTYDTSKVASLISSISFMFCGFVVVWMAYGTLAYAILYLPLALFAIEKYMQTKKFTFLCLLTFTVPLSFFSGHFQISLYFFLTVIFYIIYRWVTLRNTLNALYLMLCVFIGLGFSLPQLLPSLELYKHSVRSELFLLSEVIPFQYLITGIAPDFFGNPVTRNDWFGHYAEWSSFVGIWPYILAIYAIISIRKSHIKFYFIVAIASLILAVNSPLSPMLVNLKIPVLSTSSFSRIIVLFSFSFAVLAGFGFDALFKDIEKKEKKKIISLLLIVSVFMVSIWVMILFSKLYSLQWLIVAKRNFMMPTVIFIIGSLLFFLSMFSKQKIFTIVIVCYLLFTTSFDSFRFAQKWMPFGNREFVFSDVPIIEGIRKNIGFGRIFGNIGAELTTYYGFPSVEGYDPLYIGRYGEFIRGADAGEFQKGERSVVKLSRGGGKYTNRALDMLGVSLIFNPIPDTNQGWAYPVWEDKERNVVVYKDDQFELYKNTKALPRPALFYKTEVMTNEKEMIKRIYSDNFDYRNVLMLEENINTSLEEGVGNAKIISYTPNNIKIEANTNVPALLFLSDNFYPGWKAFVNGKETKIYRADYAFRAVVVPSGKLIIEFTYENWNF